MQMALAAMGAADTTAPTITSANTASVAENATLSHALTANESVTWLIVSGADQAKFEISGSTLRWASNGTKDFETPDDADTDNAYVVTVRATDGSSNTTDQTITVTVTDVARTATFQTNTFSTSSSTNYSFSTQAIGTAASDRRVIVGVSGTGGVGSNPAVSSVTVGGISATLLKRQQGSNAQSAELWIADVPTGTTATIAVNWSTLMSRMGLGVWSCVGLTSDTPIATGGLGGASGFSTSNTGINISASPDGFAVAYAYNNGSTSLTWTNVSSRFLEVIASPRTHSGADTATTGSSITITCTPGASDANSSYVVVSF